MKTGFIVGRFQCPYIHIGHIHLISSALRREEKVVILLGRLKDIETNDKNPYSAKYITEQIHKIFPQVEVKLLFDKNDDIVWSTCVDAIIDGYGCEATLYHSRDSFVSHYSGNHKTFEIEEIPEISATKIRQQNS